MGWIEEAIAEQEEYIRRIKGCNGVYCAPHKFERFRGPDSSLPVPNEKCWNQCIRCDVTETRADYAIKIGTHA